jgi:hypothetical protein
VAFLFTPSAGSPGVEGSVIRGVDGVVIDGIMVAVVEVAFDLFGLDLVLE